MPVEKCRVCGSDFFKEPLLKYKNMPKTAQYLPDAASLHLDKGVDLTVCQCSACGLVQLSNDPVPYFREVIRAVGISKEMIDFRTDQFAKFIAAYDLHKKKVIEIGCGRGEFISIFKDFDVDIYGLDFSEESVRYCNDNGLKVEKGFIEAGDEKLSNGPFEVFFILNFLEHLPDPNRTLTGIHHNLNDDAVGIIEVPNFNMMLRKNLFSEFICDHLFYFTEDTLKITLERNGFEVIECKEIWYDYIISATVRKRKRTDISQFYQYQKKLTKEIADYINRFEDKKVAIWGAGHQALAFISLTNISKRIKYVVDSAPFKQGKFTPASHIPIVSPEKLNNEPVNAVIVMAASYSDEVARIIRRNYHRNICVAILRDFGLEEV